MLPSRLVRVINSGVWIVVASLSASHTLHTWYATSAVAAMTVAVWPATTAVTRTTGALNNMDWAGRC